MPGATIRYAVAPQTVSPSSPMYAAPFAITSTTTINAGAYHPDYTWSGQASGTYTLAVAPPMLSHASGTYPAGQVVTVTSATEGAVLRYTLNGAAPTTNDPVVPAGGIVAGNFTLKVAGWKTGYTPSSVVTATYQVTGSLTSPLIAAGDNHSVAVRADGSLWAWGANIYGRWVMVRRPSVRCRSSSISPGRSPSRPPPCTRSCVDRTGSALRGGTTALVSWATDRPHRTPNPSR
ncbi:MAG: chitobiase/beta-hexosaminidase C-terminal domain-containing protein [Micromonosporaceae bacterium]